MKCIICLDTALCYFDCCCLLAVETPGRKKLSMWECFPIDNDVKFAVWQF